MEPRNGEEGHAQGETAEGRDESPETPPKKRSAAQNGVPPPGQATEARQGREGEGPTRKPRPKARPKAASKRPAAREGDRRSRPGGPPVARGRESTLAQTPETGRSVRGRTNPMPTKRSTGTAAGAGGTRMAPGLERERKRLREVEESVQGPPSSLNMDRHSSAARSGRAALRQAKREHTETSPALTGGDVDADWEDAYAVGDEAPGGDNPTPDQDRVDDIGRALGIDIPGQRRTEGGRQDHRARSAPLGARSRVRGRLQRARRGLTVGASRGAPTSTGIQSL